MDAVLIDWQEYNGSMELLVVFDGSLKAMEFRVPVLYSAKQDVRKIAA